MENRNTLLSRTISFLRFPMIFFILYLHVVLGTWNDGSVQNSDIFVNYERVRFFFVESISRIFVPCFFFISGFLFFYGRDFSGKVYREKLKRRFRSLVVPYVFWNLFVVFLYFIGEMFVPSLMSGQNQVTSFGIRDLLMCFWNIKDGSPINLPLWFLRDLIVLSVFSPVIYVCVWWGRHWVVLLTALLWLLWGMPTNCFVGIFFFTAGAFLGIKNIDFVMQMLPWRKLFLLFYVVVMWSGVLLLWHGVNVGEYLQKAGILLGLCSVLSWTGCLLEKHPLRNRLLERSSFLVYAYHGLPLLFLSKLSVYLLHPDSSWELIVLFLLLPVVVSVIGVGLYAFIDRFVPGLNRWISGR